MEMAAGTVDRLIEDGKQAGVTGYLVHSVATTAHQVHAINEFIKREMDAHSEFIGFMTLHQDMTEEEVVSEVKWAKENGFKSSILMMKLLKSFIERLVKIFLYYSIREIIDTNTLSRIN